MYTHFVYVCVYQLAGSRLGDICMHVCVYVLERDLRVCVCVCVCVCVYSGV